MQCMSTQSICKENTVDKIRLYVFIYDVDTVDTTFREYSRFNGTYVDTVDTIKLQCKS